jgi:hypothetical protein
MAGPIEPIQHEQLREQLRAEYGLRSLSREEEGARLQSLPAGVFGFTYSPATETPLFAGRTYHSFEIHKLSGGGTFLIAFAAPAEAERIRSGEAQIEATVFPDPYEQATELVRISYARIVNNLYKPIRYDGNALPLRIGLE